jgi:GNAT superfamily N-acetyltransferase
VGLRPDRYAGITTPRYNSDTNVRPGTSGDWAAVLPMLRKHRALHEEWDKALYALRPDADAEARFKRWLGPAAEDPRALLLVMENDDHRVIGFMTALVEKDVPIYVADEYAVIRDIWVEPAQRRHGAGKRLVEAAIAELSAMGLKQVRIRTAAANEPVRKMLLTCGFRVGTIDMVRELDA